MDILLEWVSQHVNKYDKWGNMARRRWFRSHIHYLIALVSMFALSGCSNVRQAESGAVPTYMGPHASWQAQLSAAQQEVARIHKDASVMWVLAHFDSCQTGDPKPGTVSFIFMRPSGARVRVEIKDTDPPSVVKVDPEYDVADKPLSKEELQHYSQALASVKVSPREACERTAHIEADLSSSPSAQWRVGMFLDLDKEQQYDLPSTWRVQYYDSSTKQQLLVLVSPQTGEILKTIKDGTDPEQPTVLPLRPW